MNKKKIFALSLISLFAISFVAAIGYYAIFSTTFTVAPAIVIEDSEQIIDGEVYSGGIIEGEEIIISNDAPTERTISLSAEAECDVTTSYASTVDMNKKDFEWTIIPDTTVILSYTVIADEFKYKIDTELENYVVVYYPDLDGNPGSWNIDNAELVGDADTEWTSSDLEVLPNEDDWNNKAKIWVIPEEDWNAQSWNPSEWYFENNLVEYGETITIDAESSMTLIPLYEIGVGVEGDCTVTTTVA